MPAKPADRTGQAMQLLRVTASGRVRDMAAAGPPEFVNHCLDQLRPLGAIECRRFFGGWQFRSGGVQFAAVMRGVLHLRVSGDLQAELLAAGGRPFRYARRDREVEVAGYCSLPDAALDDDDMVRDWAGRALHHALSQPAKAPKRRGKRA